MKDFWGVDLKVDDKVVFARRYGETVKLVTGTVKNIVYPDDGEPYVLVNDGFNNYKFSSLYLIKYPYTS